MPVIENTVTGPSTPKTQRQDDFLFSTPTNKADLDLKMEILERRHEGRHDFEPTTPTCSADIEEQLMTATKLHDDYWDDFCALMRKAGKKLDAEQATKEELQRKHAYLKAQLAEMDASDGEIDEVEVIGTSASKVKTRNARDKGNEQETGSEKSSAPKILRGKRKAKPTAEKKGRKRAARA